MIAVTFDTNTLRPLVERHKRTSTNQNVFKNLEIAVKKGLIQPFASDTIINLEGQPRPERQKHWGSLTNVVTHEDKGLQRQDDGTEAFERKITITPTFASNDLPEPLKVALQAALNLGVRFIKTPRVGMPMLPAHMYKEITGESLKHAIDGCCQAIKAFESKGCGSFHAVAMAREKTQHDPDLAMKGMMAFAIGGGKNAIAEALAEWSDGDSLAAHFGYQHDYFCTMDEGKSAGKKSILHISHRLWLEQQFNIKIISPEQLLAIVELR